MKSPISIADLSPSAQRQALEQISGQRRETLRDLARLGQEIEQQANPHPLRKSKYNNKKCELEGYKFDSLKEANRYLFLKARLHEGAIVRLQIHPKFRLEVNGIKVATYIADFRYWEVGGGRVIEDVKGVKTALYNIKKKLMLACHGVEVKEI